ncbi:ABC transporter permease [Chitinibacteraceae bacterium HSL-7]
MRVVMLALARAPVRRVLAKQIYFTGIEALPIVLLLGVALGGILVNVLHGQYGQSTAFTLKLLAQVCFSELAPLLVAMTLIARSSSAVASELASMRIHGELRSLQRMGIDLVEYLVVPRVIGVSFSAGALGLMLAVAAQVAGMVFASGFDVRYGLLQVEQMLGVQAIVVCVVKSMLFGAVAVLVAIVAGWRAQPLVTEIPRASSRAVVWGLAAVFLAELVWVMA